MNTVNKIAAFMLIFAMPLSFAACTVKNGDMINTETSAVVQTELEEETEEALEPQNQKTIENIEFYPTVYKNITYKKAGDAELQLDIYGPTVPTFGPVPVLLYVHGGSWVSGTRSIEDAGQITAIVDGIRALGVAVVPVSYRLTSETVTFPAHINDVCDAIRFIVKYADEYNLDPQRIGLIGFSAGGHLSLLAGFCTTEFGDAPELAGVEFDVKCVIDFCGPADLTQLTDVPTEAERVYALAILKSFLGAELEGNEELYAYASPISHVGKNPDLSLLVVQGKNDELVPYVQVDRLYERCSGAGYDIKYILVENATHAFAPADTSRPTSPTLAEIITECVEFIKAKLIA